jgi:hypothetical protein
MKDAKHFCLKDIRELLYSKVLSILSDPPRSSRQDKLNLEVLHASMTSPMV